jgi:hypothetical protein
MRGKVAKMLRKKASSKEERLYAESRKGRYEQVSPRSIYQRLKKLWVRGGE